MIAVDHEADVAGSCPTLLTTRAPFGIVIRRLTNDINAYKGMACVSQF